MPRKETLAFACHLWCGLLQLLRSQVWVSPCEERSVLYSPKAEYKTLRSRWTLAQQDFKIPLLCCAVVIWDFLLPRISDLLYLGLYGRQVHIIYEYEGDISSPKHPSGKIAQGPRLLKMRPMLLWELTDPFRHLEPA